GMALTCPDLNVNSPTVHGPVQQFQLVDRMHSISNEWELQYWTLEPAESGGEQGFLIHPFLVPAFAIAVDRIDFPDPTEPASLWLDKNAAGQVWRISRIANPSYFFLLEGDNDLLMDVPDRSHDHGVTIQVYPRTENQNQQWTFMPAFDQIAM